MTINWHGVGAAVAGLLGVVSSPAVLGILPPKYAAAISAAAVVYAALSKPAVTTGDAK